MTERSRNIMVGLTAIGGLLALAILLLLFGYVPAALSPGYMVNARMLDSQGVSDSSRVSLYGIDVGKVETVTLLDYPDRGVMLKLRIREGIKLPVGTRLSISTPLLGGTPAVSLDTSKAESDNSGAFLPLDGSGELLADTETGSLESRMGKELRAALESASNDLVGKIEALSSEWTAVGQNINQLVTPRLPEDVDSGKAQGNLASAVARIDDRVRELSTSLEALNKWASDEKMREDVRVTMANARSLTTKMDTSLDNINKVTATADKSIDKLATRFTASADDLSATILSMQKTLDEIRNGKGTTGKLINDPALYDNLNDSVERIGKAADEFKLMMEKWRKEGLPLQL